MRINAVIAAGIFIAACQPVVPGSGTAGDGPDNGDAARGDAAVAPPTYPEDKTPPTVVITAPAQGSTVDTDTVAVRGTATDDVGIAALMVRVGLNVEQPAGLPARDGTFALSVSPGPGQQSITVRAVDIGGNAGSDTIEVVRPYGFDSAQPVIAITAPITGFATDTPNVAVTGTASDDIGIAEVTITVDGAPAALAHTDDNFATWYYPAMVQWRPDGQPNQITARAEDVAGKLAEVTVTGSSNAVADRDPPMVVITSPAAGTATGADDILIAGTATDAGSGLASVEIRVGAGPYRPVITTDDFATWTATVSIAPGDNIIKVKATDRTGNAAAVTLTVINTSGELWTPPVTVNLTWAPPAYPASTFNLDKAGLAEMMSGGVAEQIEMLEVDLYPVVRASLDQIGEACGPNWEWSDVSASCPASWGQQEINMYRLITMTPANVNVAGTSIQGMEELAGFLNGLGLIDDFHEILAASLGTGLYDTIVPADAVANAIFWDVIVPHPNTTDAGFVVVTMADALNDMTTLAPRFDAAGAHPGFLDSVTGNTFSEVLLPAFQMTMVATSNLHWHDGVDLGTGKAYLALNADITGPTFDDVLEFDFLSPATFSISGLADKPTVDMVFKMKENDGWISIGDSRYPLEEDPGWPVGNSEAWSLDSWALEFVLIDSAYVHYWDHRAGCSLCDGTGSGALLYEAPWIGTDESEIVVGHAGYDFGIFGQDGVPENFPIIAPNPAGWMRIWSQFGLGHPPSPQYVWDMILEVCEQRLLDGGVTQGNGDVRFPLFDLPIGMTGEEIKDATRPVLEAQKSKLSDLLLGDISETARALDFYLAKGADGALYLYFVHPSDPVPDGTAGHAKPGFYTDEGLTTKVSFTAPGTTGDNVHEKLGLTGEQTVYCQDTDGVSYRLIIEPAVGYAVTLHLRQRIGGP